MVLSMLLYSFGIILSGLLLGYAAQVLAARGLIRLPVSMDTLRKGLQRTALLFVNPVAIVGATWIVSIRDAALVAMPFVGLFAIVTGGVLALGAARLLHLPPKKTGALFCCGSFTNIGSIGALVCYLFLGEPGFALVPIYKIFEELSYYSTGFPDREVLQREHGHRRPLGPGQGPRPRSPHHRLGLEPPSGRRPQRKRPRAAPYLWQRSMPYSSRWGPSCC